jgi:molybdenum cofactor cytidylyltransferase
MKLTVDLDGAPLVARTIGSLLDGGASRVVVVVSDPAVLAGVSILAHARVTVVVNTDPSRGMFSSIQTGLGALDADAYLVLPADMPFVKASTVAAVAGACSTAAGIVVPNHQGRRGHPIGVPGRLRTGLLAADPAASLRHALVSLGGGVTDVPVDDPGTLRDVDIPADLSGAGGP